MNKKRLSIRLSLFLVFFGLLLSSCEKDNLTNSQPNHDVELLKQKLKERISQKADISEEIATAIAANFLAENNNKEKKSYQVKSTSHIKDYNDDIALYAINLKPEGFVLVSSNTRNIPVIAYSDKGIFKLTNTTPDGLKSWLAEAIIINNELEKSEKPLKEIEHKWSILLDQRNFPDPDDEIIVYNHSVNNLYGPLLQTLWNQRAPYNEFTPNNWPTGCVAVATAQVMRYHQWPNTFSWTIMPNNPPAWSTTAGSFEIADLMADIGEEVNMDYSATGSGAQTADAINALVNDYQYSSQAYYANYNFNTTKNEIISNRPVIMDGFHTTYTTGWWFWPTTHYEDGHAWVCDGYKLHYDVYIHNPGTYYEYTTQENRNEWLHMNWGWGGDGNGWFINSHIYVSNDFINIDGVLVHPDFKYKRRCIYKIKK